MFEIHSDKLFWVFIALILLAVISVIGEVHEFVAKRRTSDRIQRIAEQFADQFSGPDEPEKTSSSQEWSKNPFDHPPSEGSSGQPLN